VMQLKGMIRGMPSMNQTEFSRWKSVSHEAWADQTNYWRQIAAYCIVLSETMNDDGEISSEKSLCLGHWEEEIWDSYYKVLKDSQDTEWPRRSSCIFKLTSM
jgi:hypothetical protein